MRAVKHIPLFLLLLVVSSAAQMRNPPPASIYSVGGSVLGGPPASIYSLPTQSIGLVGVGRTCCAISNFGPFRHPVPFRNDRRFHSPGRRPHFGGIISVPFYFYPAYPYYAVAAEPPSESLQGAGTFDRRSAGEEYGPPGLTVFERGARTERPASAEDSRYGEHYLDSRDTRKAEPEPQPSVPEESTTTVLVFRDGHRSEVRNYAIMGTTLWVLSPDRRRIPLTDLDLQATARENDDRGVDFRVPAAE